MARLTWNGNSQAQKEADRAYARLRPKKRRRSKKQKRTEARRVKSLLRDTIRDEYQTYLRSPEWQKIRRAALKRAKYRCAKCGSAARLHVHHLTYRNFGCEKPGDVQVLCHDCHVAHHREERKREAIRRKNRHFGG